MFKSVSYLENQASYVDKEDFCLSTVQNVLLFSRKHSDIFSPSLSTYCMCQRYLIFIFTHASVGSGHSIVIFTTAHINICNRGRERRVITFVTDVGYNNRGRKRRVITSVTDVGYNLQESSIP